MIPSTNGKWTAMANFRPNVRHSARLAAKKASKQGIQHNRRDIVARRRRLEKKHARVPALFPKLFALPPELRELVYEFAIDTDRPRSIIPDDARNTDDLLDKGPREPGLAMVSKAVRAEALGVFYRKCLFRIHDCLRADFPTSWEPRRYDYTRAMRYNWPGTCYAGVDCRVQRGLRLPGGEDESRAGAAGEYDVTTRPRFSKLDLCIHIHVVFQMDITIHLRFVAGVFKFGLTWQRSPNRALVPRQTYQMAAYSFLRSLYRARSAAVKLASAAASTGFDMQEVGEIFHCIKAEEEDYKR